MSTMALSADRSILRIPTERVSEPVEDRVARISRALGHPLRVRILAALLAEDELSPRQFSRRCDEPLGTISYHFRYLAAMKALELRRTVPRRGALEHFYEIGDDVREVLRLGGALLSRPPSAGRLEAPPAGPGGGS